jgi:hypothetical protein
MSLDETLYKLLFRRSSREAFLRGELVLARDEAEALSAIDGGQLERASRLSCEGILTRSHRGTGSLRDAFARTISAWSSVHPGAPLFELAAAFTESRPFDAYRALPTCAGGASLEEAFFQFAEESAIGDAPTRLAEYAGAILRALVVTPKPSFRIPDFVRHAPGGYFAVLEAGPALVASLDGRFVTGPITPFLAALLDARETPDRVAARFGVDARGLEEACAELRRLRLVP